MKARRFDPGLMKDAVHCGWSGLCNEAHGVRAVVCPQISVLRIALNFETDLVAKIERNHKRSWVTSRILRLRSGQSGPKAGCENKGFI